jgi:hypothetical protein
LRVDAASVILNPYSQMEFGIGRTAKRMGDYFDSVDAALARGTGIRHAVGDDEVTGMVRQLAAASRLMGFRHGQKMSGARTPALYGDTVKRFAARRGAKVDRLMGRATRSMLRSDIASEFVLSGDRALRAARYEAGKAYYRGLRDAVGGGFEKRLITSAGESCDYCQETEDEGYIPAEESFESGIDLLPAHLNCACYLAYRRVR